MTIIVFYVKILLSRQWFFFSVIKSFLSLSFVHSLPLFLCFFLFSCDSFDVIPNYLFLHFYQRKTLCHSKMFQKLAIFFCQFLHPASCSFSPQFPRFRPFYFSRFSQFKVSSVNSYSRFLCQTGSTLWCETMTEETHKYHAKASFFFIYIFV